MHAAPKRFLLIVAVTAGLIVGLFWLASARFLIGFMPEEYAMWATRQAMIAGCQLPPLVIQGDSRAAAGFLPARIGNAVNVAVGGATPVETFYAAQEILKCGQAPRHVILSISPELFVDSRFFWDRSVLFGFLRFGQLEEIRQTSRELGDTIFYEPARFGDLDAMLENALRAMSFPSYYTSYLVNHVLIGRLAENRAVQARTVAARGQHGYGRDDGSSEVAGDARMQTFKPSPLLNVYMERLLDGYAARGTTVQFIAVPMNRATFDRMNPAALAQFQRYLDQLAARHPNFHVAGPAVAALDDAYFGDSAHLNRRGAEVFSDHVGRLMRDAPGGVAAFAR